MKFLVYFLISVICVMASVLTAKHFTLASLASENSIFENFQKVDSNWYYSDKIGARTASARQRAKVALGGPLGLSAKEAIYFIAISDNKGRRLSSACDYQVTGNVIDTRWWSLTLYDSETEHYVPNEINRSSWNSVMIPKSELGVWTINVSQSPNVDTWLPSQAGDGKPFELALRAYNPSDKMRARIPDIALPEIERISC